MLAKRLAKAYLGPLLACLTLPSVSQAESVPGSLPPSKNDVAELSLQLPDAALPPIDPASAQVTPPARAERSIPDEPVEVEAPFDPAAPAPTAVANANTLYLSAVVDSMLESYPLLEIAVIERFVREGDQLAAAGKFDTNLRAESMSQPLGFYRTYRNSLGVSQPLWRGGSLDVGYRKGDGNFEPWYGFRETDEGGEFGASLYLPWLQNRRIDPRRADLFRARIDRAAVEPQIQTQFLQFLLDGTTAYWNWVADGQVVIVTKRLLHLAESRRYVLEQSFKSGRINELTFQDNERLVAIRRAKLIQAEQKLRSSAIKMSLFFRSPTGEPIIAEQTGLPPSFPIIADRRDEPLQKDIDIAWQRRPELNEMNYERQRLNVAFAEARNLYMPQADTYLAVKDDIGTPASDKGDKSELELEAGVVLSMPVQRRQGLGKMQAVRGKIAQLNQKVRFQRDKIAVDVQSAINDLALTYDRVQYMREAARLAEVLAEAERTRLQLGKADLLALYLREDSAADAILGEIDSLFDYYVAVAQLRFAMAEDIDRVRTKSLWCR
jgi:outer membrane protein TolC